MCPSTDSQPKGPVPKGSSTDGRWHRIRQGETIGSLAKKNGHLPETIWDHPANEELKNRRQNQNILLPGDWVFIPDKRPKEESGGTEIRHRFKMKTPSQTLVLQIIPSTLPIHSNTQKPQRSIPYTLSIGNRTIEGETESEGIIRVEKVPPDVNRAILTIMGRSIQILIGHLDPEDEDSGIQGRLHNLGYLRGGMGSIPGPQLQAALRTFQKLNNLQVAGEPNTETQTKLKDLNQI
jgi:N-acetylmuramoyl-L-alanine amidase